MLEPYDAKLSRTVLRGNFGGNPSVLPGHIRNEIMLGKNIVFWVLICITSASTIYAADGSHSSLGYKIYVGYGYFDYYEINNQLEKYHQIDNISNLPILGLEINYMNMGSIIDMKF